MISPQASVQVLLPSAVVASFRLPLMEVINYRILSLNDLCCGPYFSLSNGVNASDFFTSTY